VAPPAQGPMSYAQAVAAGAQSVAAAVFVAGGDVLEASRAVRATLGEASARVSGLIAANVERAIAREGGWQGPPLPPPPVVGGGEARAGLPVNYRYLINIGIVSTTTGDVSGYRHYVNSMVPMSLAQLREHAQLVTELLVGRGTGPKDTPSIEDVHEVERVELIRTYVPA
jgi:hypothetical protein